MLHSVASDLDLHYLPVTLLGLSKLKWVKAWHPFMKRFKSKGTIFLSEKSCLPLTWTQNDEKLFKYTEFSACLTPGFPRMMDPSHSVMNSRIQFPFRQVMDLIRQQMICQLKLGLYCYIRAHDSSGVLWFHVGCLCDCPSIVHPSVFHFRMITWVNISGLSPNLVCALILWRSGLWLLMGKFRQILTELPAHILVSGP